MGEIKDLRQRGATDKMRNFIQLMNTCMFCTRGREFPFHTRPMATAQVDGEGNFWFISNRYSLKNAEISRGSSVQLIYAEPGEAHFMSVYGNALISYDEDKVAELWNPLAGAWFPKGMNDPAISLIKVIPVEAYYWDTRQCRMVSLITVADTLLTGARIHDGVEGKLAV